MILESPENKFTPEAEDVWAVIPTSAKGTLINKVWCPSCFTATVMVDFNGYIENEDLVLHGRCAICGGSVARVIECG